MTFTPSIQSVTDTNNTTSTPTASYLGAWTSTNGYEGISLNIICSNNSTANGVKILFSNDNGVTTTKTISDTFFANINYSNTFKALDLYYRISFSTASLPGTLRINTRLLTASPGEIQQNTFYNSNDPMIDAFGKLRVSNPFTLLDIKFPAGAGTTEFVNNTELVCTRTIGPGTYSGTISSPGIGQRNITGSGIGTFISQSRKYCTYLPGKSLLVLCSGVINAGAVIGVGANTGMTTYIGLFDDLNGFYFSFDSSVISVNYKSNNIVGSTTPQTNWNIDPMDGTGISTLNLDFTKTQLFVIDFEWLGVGRIRFGFYAFGKINYCHQITNLNTLTAPYMQSPNLPVRYQIVGGGAGSVGGLIQICSTVISEGGYNPMGRPFTANNGLPSSNNVTASETPLLAIKGGTNYNHQNIIPLGIEIINTANTTAAIIYRIRYFLAPSPEPGTFTWNDVGNYSVMQYATNPTGVTFTGSIVVEGGYFTGRGTSEFNSLSEVFSNVVQITSDASGVSDILLITAQIQTGNAQVAVSIQWQEVY